jgi:hypothetical protein
MIQQLVVIQESSGLYFNSGKLYIFFSISIFLFPKLSLLPGNIYIYLSLKTEVINRSTRYSLFSIFSVVSGVSLTLFILIIWRSYIERRRDTLIKVYEEKNGTLSDIGRTLKTAGQLLKTRNILLLLVLFFYLGKCLYKYPPWFLYEYI